MRRNQRDKLKGLRVSDIFEEVEEGLRTDQATTLWNRFWPFGLGAVVAIVALVGGKSWLDAKAEDQLENAGKAFELGRKAMEAEDLESVRKYFGEAQASDTGFQQLAGSYLAAAELKLSGDRAAAAASLRRSAEGATGPLAEASLLKALYIEADTLDLAGVENAAASLIERGGPYAALAREVIASKAFEIGDMSRAREEFNALSFSLDAPEGLQQRAIQALSIIPDDSDLLPTASDGAGNMDDTDVSVEDAQ